MEGTLLPSCSRTRWPERGSTGWQLRHEGVSAAVEAAVEGALGGGEVGGGGFPRHVSPAISHCDAAALIETCSSKEGGVVESRVDDAG